MVVADQQLEVFAARAHPERCSKRPRGKITRCALSPGHTGHHQARVTVRRADGRMGGYVRYWLD